MTLSLKPIDHLLIAQDMFHTDARIASNTFVILCVIEFRWVFIPAAWACPSPERVSVPYRFHVRLVHELPVYQVWHGLYLSGEMDEATRQFIFNILS